MDPRSPSPIYTLWNGFENIEVYKHPDARRPVNSDLDSTTQLIIKTATKNIIVLFLATKNPFPDSNPTERNIWLNTVFKETGTYIRKAHWCTKHLATEVKHAVNAFLGANDQYRDVIKTMVSWLLVSNKVLILLFGF